MSVPFRSHRDLKVYNNALDAAMAVHFLAQAFPRVERYEMTSQVLRASRSVCANLGEAWRKRHYPDYFVSKLTDCQGEAGETQVWLEIAARAQYITTEKFDELFGAYDIVLAQLNTMCRDAQKWTKR